LFSSYTQSTCITHLQCCKLHTITVPERCSLAFHQKVSFIARDMFFLMTLFISVKIRCMCLSSFGRNCSCNLIYCISNSVPFVFEAPLTNSLNGWVSDWLWALQPSLDSQQVQDRIFVQRFVRFRSQFRLSGWRFCRMWCHAAGRQVLAFCRSSLPKFTT
jgi:hypothetical protein